MSGLIVVEIMDESYGGKIGFKVNDILLKLNGNLLSVVDDLTSLLRANAGKKVAFKVSREGNEYYIEAEAASLGVMLMPNISDTPTLESRVPSQAVTKRPYAWLILLLSLLGALPIAAFLLLGDTTLDPAVFEHTTEKPNDAKFTTPSVDETVQRIVEHSGVFRYGKVSGKTGKASGQEFGLLVVHPKEGVSVSALVKESGDNIGGWFTDALCTDDLRQWLLQNRRWSPLVLMLESDGEDLAGGVCASAKQDSQNPVSSVGKLEGSTQLSNPFENYQAARSHFGNLFRCGWEKESPPDNWSDYRLWSCKYREEFSDTVAFYINEGIRGSVDSYKLLWRVKGANNVVLEEAMVWRKIVANALGVPEIAAPIDWSKLERKNIRLNYTLGEDGKTATHVIRVEPLN